MEKRDNVLVISPHCDDAAFSTWATMSRADSITVITVCDGIPDIPGATSYDKLTGAKSSVERARARVEEDRRAMEALGGKRVGLGFLDSQYRGGDQLDMRALTHAIHNALSSAADRILVPASIGGHRDHVLVRDAALEALRHVRTGVWLYADLPYSGFYGWATWVTSKPATENLDVDAYYARSLDELDRTHWSVESPVVVTLSPEEQRRKEIAMRTYATQFPVTEGGPSQWLTHRDRLPFEVLWPLKPTQIDAGP